MPKFVFIIRVCTNINHTFMKKFTLLAATAACLTAMALGGCGNDLNETEKKIAGKWHCLETIEFDAGKWHCVETIDFEETEYSYAYDVTVDVTDTYESDRTFKTEGELIVKVYPQWEETWETDAYYNVVTFTYSLSCEGTWSASEKELTTKGDADSFECELKEWKAIENDDIAEVTAEQFMTGIEDVLIREYKHEFLKEGTDKIEKLTDDTMVISYTDEETGEEMEEEYVRVK